MKISEHQIHFLMAVLWDSVSILGSMGGLTREQRHELYNELLKQQDKKLQPVTREAERVGFPDSC